MNVALRADASTAIGTGHLMRCLNVADRLRSGGAQTRFICRYIPEHLRELAENRGHAVTVIGSETRGEPDGDLAHSHWLGTSQAIDVDETRAALDNESFDWLIVDHYALDARWETAMRARCDRILAIDDLADRTHDCDLIVDQNLCVDMDTRYDGRVPAGCEQLIGPAYALLSEPFTRLHPAIGPRQGSVRRILIAFGGVDQQNHTGAAIDAAAAIDRMDVAVAVVIGASHPRRHEIERACSERGFILHVQTSRMAELIATADLVIGAGGTSLWERCCLGAPAVAFSAAANQTEGLEEAARRGLAYVPSDSSPDPASIEVHLRALLANDGLRELVARTGWQTVDGRGAERVARRMAGDGVAIRAATLADARPLFEWRNHETVRGASNNPAPIAWDDHEAWLTSVLADPNRALLIGERDGAPVGVVRFDVAGPRANVSIYRVPGILESGVGAALLAAAEQWVAGRYADVRTLTADVLATNEPSHRLFQSARYRRVASRYEKVVEANHA